MLASASAQVPFPSNEVASLLADPSHPWSVGLDGDGRHLLAKVGITVGRVPIYKHVRLLIGASKATLRPGRVMLPVAWEAVGGPLLFPMMEGTLHVEPDGPATTRLTLNARYDPPLGRLGRLMDRALMHRVAQMTMVDFMGRLAAALGARL